MVDFYFGTLIEIAFAVQTVRVPLLFRSGHLGAAPKLRLLHFWIARVFQAKTWNLSSKLRWIKKFLHWMVCILRLIVIRHPMPNVYAIILFRKQFHTNSLDAFWSFIVLFGVQVRCLALTLVFGGSCEHFLFGGLVCECFRFFVADCETPLCF